MLLFNPIRKFDAAALAGERVVVVGFGMVAHRFCTRLLAGQSARRSHRLILVGEEPFAAYDRIRLSESLSHNEESLALKAIPGFVDAGAEWVRGTTVVAIERQERRVTLSDGRSLSYDKLVLATGSRPFVPPVPGIDGPRVFTYRTLQDLQQIAGAAKQARSAAVLGGGLLGLEAARLLRGAGLSVTVLEAGSSLMPRQLDADSGEVFAQEIQARGVQVRTGCRLERIEAAAASLELIAAGGRLLRCDMLVVAAGVRPRDELARDAGLKVGSRGGVMVDDYLGTNDPNIFAIGECVSHRGTGFGLVAPGYRMADVLAERMLGRRARFVGADNSCHLKLMEVPVSAVGAYDRDVPTLVYEAEGKRRTLVLDGRRLLGATAVGAWPDLPLIHDLALREQNLTRRQLLRFRQSGELFVQEDGPAVANWPADTLVCNCVRVTRGELSACVEHGADSAACLKDRTGAGSACGSCEPLLAELAGAPLVQIRQPGRGLVWVSSIVASSLVLALLLAGPLPSALSVTDMTHRLDGLIRTPDYKQLTGYGSLALGVLGMLLSARKRVRWFRLGNFGHYRALHTSLGVATLLLAAAHTGMRLGSNLNMALMLSFLAVCFVGAGAGMLAVMEARRGGGWARWARRLRPALTLSHILVAWPLPLLIGLHVFAFYYF